jgi:phosphoglycerate dehydrogenase-like enzyme
MNPIVLLDPAPRTVADIFTPSLLDRLQRDYTVVARGDEPSATFYAQHLPSATFVIGQPALDKQQISMASSLKAIVNVEGNFLQNMDYAACFARNVHILSISPVFAHPVAELALGLTLSLARDIPSAHQSFVEGHEHYGLASNQQAKLIENSRIGFIGFGDLGRAIHRVLAGFRCQFQVFDPWLSPELLVREGMTPVTLDVLLKTSDIVYVVASVTTENNKLLGKAEFEKMPVGAMLLLMSRADVVDFPALIDACSQGHIRAATDVFPTEPVAADDPIRTTPNLILSAHRAGALDSALYEIGERTLADLDLMQRGLPPQNCKRAEPELIGRLRSKPVEMS